MDNRFSSLYGSSFNPYSGHLTDLPFDLSSVPNTLNVDPRYLKPEPEYILPEGQQSHNRGRLELAFSTIGGSVMAGVLIGGLRGFTNATRNIDKEGLSKQARRSLYINSVRNHSVAFGNTLGVLAVLYSGFGVLLEKIRGHDDVYPINMVTSGTLTGMLYRTNVFTSTKENKGVLPPLRQGMWSVARGGVYGCGIALTAFGIRYLYTSLYGRENTVRSLIG